MSTITFALTLSVVVVGVWGERHDEGIVTEMLLLGRVPYVTIMHPCTLTATVNYCRGTSSKTKDDFMKDN